MGIESLCLSTSLILVFRGINQGEIIEFSSHYSLLFSFFNDFLTSYRYFSIVSSWSKALLNKYLVCVFGYCRTQQVQQDSDGLNWKRHLSSKSRWSWGSSMICCWTWRSIREKRKTAVSSSSSGGESTRLFQPEGLSTWHRIVCFARRLVECEPASEAWKWYRQQGRIGTDGSWSVMKLSVLFFGGVSARLYAIHHEHSVVFILHRLAFVVQVACPAKVQCVCVDLQYGHSRRRRRRPVYESFHIHFVSMWTRCSVWCWRENVEQ